eukprot:TRINITY_DN4231_c0_g1_i1.p1 TRINITY_DN4231_c0_g1~~TRINITY_DN4231_c0_g1_i1.p1  ORF type:complete len:1287 (+),score=379.66 TRINITY_DN4231_c0_g1_i1:74-3934(+)
MAQNGSRFLQLFWDLSSVDDRVRENAAASLITSLDSFQSKYTDVEKSGNIYCPELVYTLDRLTKGLSSSRDGARQGFALALTEILRFPVVNYSTFVQQLIQVHHPNQDMSGAEIRDHLFGIVFGGMSLVRSGRIQKEFNEVSESENVETKNRVEVTVMKLVENLLKVSTMKSFLPEVCYEVLFSLLKQVPKYFFKSHLLPVFLPLMEKDPNEWKAEQVALLLNLKSIFGFRIAKHSKFWSKNKPLHPSNLNKIKPALLEIAGGATKLHSVWKYVFEHLKSSSPHNRVDFWNGVIDELFSIRSKNRWGFWFVKEYINTVDSKELGVIFTKHFLRSFLWHLTSEKRPLHDIAHSILTKIVSIARQDSKCALATLSSLTGPSGNKKFDIVTKTKTIQSLLEALDQDTIVDYLKELYDNFYTAGNVYAQAERDNEDKDDEEEDKDDKSAIDKAVNSRRAWTINQLYSIGRANVLKSEEMVASILKFFFFHSYYQYEPETDKSKIKNNDVKVLKRVCEPVLTLNLRKSILDRFFSLLGYLNSSALSQSEGKDKNPIQHYGKMSDGVYWASYILNFQETIESSGVFKMVGANLGEIEFDDDDDDLLDSDSDDSDDSHSDEEKSDKDKDISKDKKKSKLSNEESAIEPEDDDSTDLSEIRRTLLKTTQDLSKKLQKLVSQLQKLNGAKNDKNEVKSRIKQLQSFNILLLHVGLHLYSNPQETKDTVKELCELSEELFDEKRSVQGSTIVHVITDIFVSLLVRPTAVLRNVIEIAFQSFCPMLDKTSLYVILDAIKKNYDNDMEEEEESGGDDEELIAKDEEEQKKKAKENGEDDNDDGDNDDMEVDDSKKTNKNKKEKKDKKDKKDKKNDKKKVEKKVEEVEEEDDDEEEEESADFSSMDDEQMFAMDEKLSEIMKTMKDSKREKMSGNIEAINFKLRLIGLIDIFIKKQPENAFIFELIVPLIDTTITTLDHKENHNFIKKIASTIRQICKLSSSTGYPRSLSVDQLSLLNQLNGHLFQKTSLAKTNETNLLIADSINFILRVLMHQGDKKMSDQDDDDEDTGHIELDSLRTSFAKTLLNFYVRPRHLTAEFFERILYHQPKISWMLLDIPSTTRTINNKDEEQTTKEITYNNIPSMLKDARKNYAKISTFKWLHRLVLMKKHTGKNGVRFLKHVHILYNCFNLFEGYDQLSSKEVKNAFKMLHASVQYALTLQPLDKVKAMFPNATDKMESICSNSKFSTLVPIKNNISHLLSAGLSTQKTKKRKRAPQDNNDSESTTTTPAEKKTKKQKQ